MSLAKTLVARSCTRLADPTNLVLAISKETVRTGSLALSFGCQIRAVPALGAVSRIRAQTAVLCACRACASDLSHVVLVVTVWARRFTS